jgi:hypothetical protein
MKAVRTIVATAVIVFALTTVAVAGAQRLVDRESGTADGTPRSAAQQSAAVQPATVQPAAGSVTLSARQFAALLRAVGAGAGDQARAHARDGERARSHDGQHARVHAEDGRASRAVTTPSPRTTTLGAARHAATRHTTSKHATAGDRASHAGSTHNGGHDGGGHGGGHD